MIPSTYSIQENFGVRFYAIKMYITKVILIAQKKYVKKYFLYLVWP